MTLTMKRMPIGFTLGVFLLCTGQVTTLRAGERPKEFVLISFDVPGYATTAPQGINDSGDIVGNFIEAQGVRHGFLMRPGEAAVIIDYPGAGGAGGGTSAAGINAQGDIAGWYRLPGEASDPIASHGYLLSRKGQFTAIDYPGHPNTIPQRITSTGIILGCYHDLDTMESMHGFTRSADGSFTGFPLSPSMSNGAAPDGSGIVGHYENETGRHAYLIDHDRFLPFDAPDSTLTAAYDVNPQGEIVGHFRDSSGRFHGFFRDEDGEFTVLDVPDSNNVQARGINARSEIVGFYVDSGGKQHGFFAGPCGGSSDRARTCESVSNQLQSRFH